MPLSVGLAALIAVAPRTSRATELPVKLEWTAPTQCPTVDQVRARLEAIARPRPGVQLPPVEARATVESEGPGFRLELRTEREGTSGQTVLRAGDCDALAQATALMVALAFGADIELNTLAESNTPEVARVPPPPTPTASEATQTAPAPSRPAPVRSAFELGLVFTPELLHGPGVGPRLGGSLTFEHLELFVQVGAYLPSQTKIIGDVALTMSGGSALGGACLTGAATTLRASACLTAQAGWLSAASQGATRDDAATAPLVTVGPSLLVRWPERANWRLRAQADLGVSLLRARFALDGYGDVFTVPQFAPLLGLGLEFEP